MALSNVLAPGSAVTGRPPASVSMGCAMPSSGGAPVPIRPFSDWKNTCMSGGHVVCDQRRNADAEIDQHPGLQLAGNAARDDGLRFHAAHALATR